MSKRLNLKNCQTRHRRQHTKMQRNCRYAVVDLEDMDNAIFLGAGEKKPRYDA